MLVVMEMMRQHADYEMMQMALEKSKAEEEKAAEETKATEEAKAAEEEKAAAEETPKTTTE